MIGSERGAEAGGLSRRELLRRAGLVGVAATVPAAALASEASSVREREGLESLTAAEADAVEAIVDRLIPTDANGPGAAEARVARYIDRALDGELAPLRRHLLRRARRRRRLLAEPLRGRPRRPHRRPAGRCPHGRWQRTRCPGFTPVAGVLRPRPRARAPGDVRRPVPRRQRGIHRLGPHRLRRREARVQRRGAADGRHGRPGAQVDRWTTRSSRAGAGRATTTRGGTMPTTRIKETDVVVIGLGAAGGIAVLPLARAGLDVVGLEAGRASPCATSPRTRSGTTSATGSGGPKVNKEVPTQRRTAADRDDPCDRARPDDERRRRNVDPLDVPELASHAVELQACAARRSGGTAPRRSRPARRSRTGRSTTRSSSRTTRRSSILHGVSGKAGNIRGTIDPRGNVFEGPRRREYPLPPLRRDRVHASSWPTRPGGSAGIRSRGPLRSGRRPTTACPPASTTASAPGSAATSTRRARRT